MGHNDSPWHEERATCNTSTELAQPQREAGVARGGLVGPGPEGVPERAEAVAAPGTCAGAGGFSSCHGPLENSRLCTPKYRGAELRWSPGHKEQLEAVSHRAGTTSPQAQASPMEAWSGQAPRASLRAMRSRAAQGDLPRQVRPNAAGDRSNSTPDTPTAKAAEIERPGGKKKKRAGRGGKLALK
ncbi:hypothetical protein TgHK011_005412 [Trichoderma gracile]|nr:hypothetical protein TgHK011_005412 [Trichoderma gracile]